jgi:hypothetical protein
MGRRLRAGGWLAACAALACSTGPTYSQFMARTAPPPAGQGRIFVYLTDASQAPSFWPIISIDGQMQGEIRTGSFFYVDRPTGVHQIAIGVGTANAAFGTQGATQPVLVGVGPGTSSYVQVFVIVAPGMVRAELQPENTENGQRDLSSLHYLAPTPPP